MGKKQTNAYGGMSSFVGVLEPLLLLLPPFGVCVGKLGAGMGAESEPTLSIDVDGVRRGGRGDLSVLLLRLLFPDPALLDVELVDGRF